MIDRGVFYIILVIALAVTLQACVVSASDSVTNIGAESCNEGEPCIYASMEALFTAVPKEGVAPLEVQFHDQSTGNPTTWLWDFGDGTGSTEQHPKHRYDKSGKYSVTLLIKNSFGSETRSYHEYIHVSDVPLCTPTPTPTLCTPTPTLCTPTPTPTLCTPTPTPTLCTPTPTPTLCTPTPTPTLCTPTPTPTLCTPTPTPILCTPTPTPILCTPTPTPTLTPHQTQRTHATPDPKTTGATRTPAPPVGTQSLTP
ncbi:MAG: PKD domain-containing protein, partial [Methanomicrobiales archaeon]|nr:PKD domain-containing protein [Methanomicrobiales archaeon]